MENGNLEKHKGNDAAFQVMANIDSTLRQNLSDPFVKQALASGLDLRVFSDSVDKELSSLDALCIADYSGECQQIANLHKRILSCDNILLTLEDLLSTFQNRLADISSEIKTVQEQSVKMQHCLQNRQTAKVRLSQFMDDMCVPEVLVERIINAAVTDRTFIENLHELHHKLLFAKQQTFLEARACADVSDTLEKLRIESVKKVREFIMQKLYACRKPLVNYQLHEDALLRHRFFYEFLLHHDRQIARNVKDEFTETFTKLYTAYFKQYHKAIYKLVGSSSSSNSLVVHATKDDLLGLVDDGSAHGRRAPPGLFSLGMRASLLEELDSPPVVPHALQPSGQQPSGSQPSLSKEAAFRSLQGALADAALAEYAFISEFFLGQPQASQELFASVFSPSLTFIRAKTELTIVESWDLLGLMLCAVVLHHYREKAFKNISESGASASSSKASSAVPSALNDYWEALLTIILSRAEFVLSRHIGSVTPLQTAAQHSSSSLSNASAAATADSLWRPHAHPLMRRAVEMAVAVARLARLLISNVGPQSSPTWHDRFNDMALSLLTNAMTAVSGNYANSRNKDKLVFVINNYALAADVSTEQLGESAPLSTSAREKLSGAVSLYSEVTIAGLLPKLASTVRDAETAIAAAAGQQSSDAPSKPQGVLSQQALEASVTAAISEFNTGWKRSFEALQRETMAAFPDWRTGSRVFQAAAAQLVDLYQRLLRCLTSPLLAKLPTRHDAVSIHTVVVELKRYKTAF